MRITLTAEQVECAAIIGVRRRISAMRRGRKAFHGRPDGAEWDGDIEAACAEYACAIALHMTWLPVYDGLDRDGDLGAGIQVRSTKHTNGCLILHESDRPEHLFYLIIGKVPTFTIVGCITGVAGKQLEFWRTTTGRPAFFVPQQALWNPCTLRQSSPVVRTA